MKEQLTTLPAKPAEIAAATASASARVGVFYGLAAYGLWGVFPLYFHLLGQANVTPLEILVHRVWWSCLLLMVVVTLLRRWKELWVALTNRQVVATLALSTLLIAANWLTFLIAMDTDRKIEASLGYFLTPLMNVLLGVTILRERLRPAQLGSVALAAGGVALMTWDAGTLPWIALVLAVSFAFYGLCRKTVAVDSVLGLTIETLLLAPLALGYLVWLWWNDQSQASGVWVWTLLILSGAATATPLLFFAAAARRLRFVTIGFLQFLGPTLQFLLAVYVFKEPFAGLKVVSFGIIWLSIIVYAVDSLWSLRSDRLAAAMPLEDL